jgi:hypothetical protein
MGRPTAVITAEQAIATAIEIKDHLDRLAFLTAWQNGDWETVRAFLSPTLRDVPLNRRLLRQ